MSKVKFSLNQKSADQGLRKAYDVTIEGIQAFAAEQ